MITIVVASYKYGHLAAHCIESIFSQSKKPEKIIFVDDGVGDCAHIQQIYPEIQFFENENTKGTVKNFQDILFSLETEYCMFIGADNWLRSDTISLMQSIIDLDKPDIITYDLLLTGELKKIRYESQKEEMYKFQGDYIWNRNKKHHGSMLYKVELAKSVGGYAKNDVNSAYTEEDLNLWDKMVAAGAKVSCINHPLLYYRHHRENYNKY